MKQKLYKWLPIIFGCHCRSDRSFFYHGEQFPICARCTGELLGIIFSLFSCFFFRLPVWLSVLFMLPLCVDGFVQLKTSYESTNIKRVVTGFFFGYGLFMLFIVSAIFAYEYGHSLGEMLR
ncbi:MAG: DUF2085 domain-containing protein [Clostridiales bacterium]|nr:DUF2085 domain-containing protein [Clostridiales bacterium]